MYIHTYVFFQKRYAGNPHEAGNSHIVRANRSMDLFYYIWKLKMEVVGPEFGIFRAILDKKSDIETAI